MNSLEIKTRFEELGPYYTKFNIQGEYYGGEVSYDQDTRPTQFFEWCKSYKRILELGSFEGASSFALANHEGVEQVLGLEGRDFNIRKAEFVKELLGVKNVEFKLQNLEKANLIEFGHFDAVYCTGLFYHLSKPWTLLEQIYQVSNYLFIDTHYATKEEVAVDKYMGIFYQEYGYDDALSGLEEQSFWPSFKHLALMILDSGFKISKFIDVSNVNGSRAWLLCEK